jgi:hypothetical protein
MKKGHWEIRFKNGHIISDYVSKTLNDVVIGIARSLEIQNFELKKKRMSISQHP